MITWSLDFDEFEMPCSSFNSILELVIFPPDLVLKTYDGVLPNYYTLHGSQLLFNDSALKYI